MSFIKQSHILLLIGFLSIYSVSCQTQIADDQQSTAASSFSRHTVNIESIRPLLFQPEDLGFAEENYEEITDELLDLDQSIPAADVITAALYLGPNDRYGTRPYGALHNIWVYSNEEEALQVFHNNSDTFTLSLGDSTGFEPRLENVLSDCKPRNDYEFCNYFGQHGRYLILANMAVGKEGFDDNVLTMEDWGNFIYAIQDRAIRQVELDREREE